jgi:hypothetical protein
MGFLSCAQASPARYGNEAFQFVTFATDMKYKKRVLAASVLIVLSVLVHVYSDNSLRVEKEYSVGIYPPVALCLRALIGWLPFSFGDILYGAAALWLLWQLFKVIRKLIRRNISIDNIKSGLLNTLIVLLSVYVVFNVWWGINYDRKGIGYQLGLSNTKYNAADLRSLDSLLLQKVNASKTALSRSSYGKKTNAELFAGAINSYKNIDAEYPFLNYKIKSVKSSMWGWLGNYFGFTGYYNPFTGEAQVNTTVPYFLEPYTTCHEMAHQLGYAKEDEANFVGYLAASASSDTLFHYSVYLDLFLTANRNLFFVDSVSSRSFAKQLSPAIKVDLKNWSVFIKQHQSPAEPIIRWMYGKYLENNKQPSGILSYDEVTGLLIAYYKKYGKI